MNVSGKLNTGISEMKYSTGVDASLKAAVLEGEASGTASLNGSSAKGSVGGCLVCVGTGINLRVGYDTKSNDIQVDIGGMVALFVGVKIDLQFKIDF